MIELIDENFVLVLNPPDKVFSRLLNTISMTEGWAFQENDYNIWAHDYSKHWLYTVQHRGTGEHIACISLAKSEMRDGSPLYTVAFFYCLTEYRSQGLGKVLFDKIASIYGDHNCSLFGVGTMWKWYEKRYGFTHLQPYFHWSASIACKDLIITNEESKLKIEDVNLRKVMEYDATVCEMERIVSLRSWLTAPGVHAKMAISSNGACIGYGAVREVTLNRLAVSPLYADSPTVAARILRSILTSFDYSPFDSIILVFPASAPISAFLNPLCNGKFEAHEFSRNQFTRKVLDVNESKIFAIRHCAHGYV
ncbi:unnamed protein product [Caenorhabditis sp. 36 PRJEB53466]|nr:unnamed protein product [Caenorhabditis sp. 36 PRJEB53466]